jgi:hypothetical protein
MIDEIDHIIEVCESSAAQLDQPNAQSSLESVKSFYHPMVEMLNDTIYKLADQDDPHSHWQNTLCQLENHYGTHTGMTNGLPHQVSNDLVFLIRQHDNKRELIHRCVRVDTLSSSTITEILSEADNLLQSTLNPNTSIGRGLSH